MSKTSTKSAPTNKENSGKIGFMKFKKVIFKFCFYNILSNKKADKFGLKAVKTTLPPLQQARQNSLIKYLVKPQIKSPKQQLSQVKRIQFYLHRAKLQL